MPLSPRVLLSIDYEPWFALLGRYDDLTPPEDRRRLDGGFVQEALDSILEQLSSARASFFIVGEVADWYPDIPERIVKAGHELGLHCQRHRSLVDISELAADIKATESLRDRYGVRGYRAPMVRIDEAAYALLGGAGFLYSSSVYAPAGTFMRRGDVWELPVSTIKLVRRKTTYTAPLHFSRSLLSTGEFPYGSSFSIGMSSRLVLKIIESELRAGKSPVIILHPYELVAPDRWPSRLAGDMVRNPLLWPFTRNKSKFLHEVRRSFPVSPLQDFVEAKLREQESGSPS